MESKREHRTGGGLAPGGTLRAHQADTVPTMASARPDGGRNDSLSAVDVKYTKLLSTIAALEVTGNETLYALDAEIEYQVNPDRTEGRAAPAKAISLQVPAAWWGMNGPHR
jgi:hypothetical protein